MSRTAINSACNVKTLLAGVVCACVVIFAMEVATSAFQWIPSATLSAIVMVAVVDLMEFKVWRTVYKSPKWLLRRM